MSHTGNFDLDHATQVYNATMTLRSRLVHALMSLGAAQHALSELMYGTAHSKQFEEREEAHDANEELIIANRSTRNALRALAPLLPAITEPTQNPITDQEETT